MTLVTAMADMQECIDACLHCYRVCTDTAMNHCLESGGPHVDPEHFRLMMNCAEICRTSAAFMLSRSPLHARVCEVCAEVCDACADSCAQVGDMETCVQTCRACAQSCREMVQNHAAMHHAGPGVGIGHG